MTGKPLDGPPAGYTAWDAVETNGLSATNRVTLAIARLKKLSLNRRVLRELAAPRRGNGVVVLADYQILERQGAALPLLEIECTPIL